VTLSDIQYTSETQATKAMHQVRDRIREDLLTDDAERVTKVLRWADSQQPLLVPGQAHVVNIINQVKTYVGAMLRGQDQPPPEFQ
jgi:hypothetical protein